MNLSKAVKNLQKKRFYFINAVGVFFFFVFISSLTAPNFTFPTSSYSNLGNPENPLYMFFNVGFLLSVLFLSIYFRYITIKLFRNSETARLSYIIPIISTAFIALFPQQGELKFHGWVIYFNLLLLAVLTPVNAVGLARKSKRLLFILSLITIFYLLLIGLTLWSIPFDTKELGILETVIIGYILTVCLTFDDFVFDKKSKLFSKK